MAIDVSAAGQQIAAQMEAIEKDFENEEGYSLGPIITIVGIQGPDGDLGFRIRHNVDNPVLVLGLIRVAEEQWMEFLKHGEG